MSENVSPYGRGHRAAVRAGTVEPGGSPRLVIVDWRCFPEQAAVLRADKGIDVVVAGVGGGKTAVAALKALMWGLRHPRRLDGTPTEWLVLGQNFRQVRETQLEAILTHARRLCYRRGDALVRLPESAIVRNAVGGQDPRVELRSGVVFRGFSGADVDRIRSFAFDGAWLDEAEYQTEQSLMMALNRQRSARGVRVVISSSPAAAGQGWLYQVISGKDPRWDALRRANALRVHRWASAHNPTNDPSVLASIRAGIEATTPGLAAQELDGRFIGTEEAGMAGPFQWGKAFVGRATLSADEARAAVVGVDLGAQVDFTVFVVMSSKGTVLEIQRFNASTVAVERGQFYPFAEQRLVDLVSRWRAPLVKIDTAMSGAAFSQALARRLEGRARVHGYRTDSRARKSEAVEALGVAIERGQVRVPSAWTGPEGVVRPVENVELLRKEFSELVVSYHGGTRSFDHPPGAHDDLVVGLALAWQGVGAAPVQQRAGLSSWTTPKVPGGVSSSFPGFTGGFVGPY